MGGSDDGNGKVIKGRPQLRKTSENTRVCTRVNIIAAECVWKGFREDMKSVACSIQPLLFLQDTHFDRSKHFPGTGYPQNIHPYTFDFLLVSSQWCAVLSPHFPSIPAIRKLEPRDLLIFVIY